MAHLRPLELLHMRAGRVMRCYWNTGVDDEIEGHRMLLRSDPPLDALIATFAAGLSGVHVAAMNKLVVCLRKRHRTPL
jgi:hypothetical protein